MKIQSYHLKNIIEFIQEQQRNIILQVDITKYHERQSLRDSYKSYLYLFKLLKHYQSKNIMLTKHILYFTIKSAMIDFSSNKPFYNVMNMVQDLK